MVSPTTRQLNQSIGAIARAGIVSLFVLAILVIFISAYFRFSSLQMAIQTRATGAAEKVQALYYRSSNTATDELLKKQIRDYHEELEREGITTRITILDIAGDSWFAVPDTNSLPGAFPKSGTAARLKPPGTRHGSIVVSMSATQQLKNMLIVTGLLLGLCILLLWHALRRLRLHEATLSSGTDDILSAFERLERDDFSDTVAANGPLELLSLQSATNHLARALAKSRDTMNEQVLHASQEVAQSLEEMEIKNVELDLARRRAVDANHAKSSFLANISHEIRTPMNGVIGHLQLLQRSSVDEQQSAYIDRSLQSANALLDIIDDTLNLSRIEANKLDLQSLPFHFSEEINRCIVMQAPAAISKNLDIYFFCSTDFPEILIGDSLRVRQVATNLISNAIKYTEQGSIRITLDSSRKLGNKFDIVLTVEDTGLGMDSAQIDSLFEAFSQAGRSPESGTGLGLLITRSLTEALGGTLELVSQINQGSTFTVTLPMQQQGNSTVTSLPELSGTAAINCSDSKARAYYTDLMNRIGFSTKTSTAESPSLTLSVIDHEQLDTQQPNQNQVLELVDSTTTNHIVLLSTDNPLLLARLNASSRREALALHSPVATLLESINRLFTTNVNSSRDTAESDTEANANLSCSKDALKLAGVRILLADDDNFGRAYMVELLSSNGASVTSCVNGAEAAEKASTQPFDLILLDIRMPVCNGIEATRRIRAHRNLREIPIIGMTASVVPEQHMQCMQAGMTDYWVKPLKISQLLGGLEHWLLKRNEPSDTPSYEDPIEQWHDSDRQMGDAQSAINELDEEMHELLATEIAVYHARLKNVSEPDVNWIQLQDFAHKLSGTASICRLEELRQAALQLQTTSRNRDEAHLAIALDGVSRTLGDIRSIISASNRS